MIDKTFLLQKRGTLEAQLDNAKIVAAQAQGAIEFCNFLIDQCEAEELAQYGPERAEGRPAYTGSADDALADQDTDLTELEKVLPDNVSIAGVRMKE